LSNEGSKKSTPSESHRAAGVSAQDTQSLPSLPELPPFGRESVDSFDELFALKAPPLYSEGDALPEEGLRSAPDLPDLPDPGRLAGAADSRDFAPADQATGQWDFTRGAEEIPAGEDSHVIGERYRVMEGLAQGGLGAVFKVAHLQLGKIFALKLLHSSGAQDARLQKDFMREARVLSQLDHPGIVSVIDFGTDSAHGAYIVMEYLNGETLYTALKSAKRFGAGQGLGVALQVADALAYMHRRDLVHCDVKPQNLFLCRKLRGPRQRRVAKLIDFGLARKHVQFASLSTSEMGGTPIWAAPEQLSGAAPQPSMDIYSVGSLLYAMLTGTIPFEGGVLEVMEQKLAGPPPPPSQFLDRPLDERLEELVLRAMAVRPEDRPPTMERLIYELRTVTQMINTTSEWVGPTRMKASSLAQTDIAEALGAEMCRTCTIPLFLLDRQGLLQGASPAFCQLLDESAESLTGRSLGDTRVLNIYPEVEEHLAQALREGTPLKRFLSFGTRTPNPTSMVLWIIPQVSPQGAVLRLWGTLIPL